MGSVFEAWQTPLLEPNEFRALGDSCGRLLGVAQARYLIAFSLLAPSTHNTVPQAYRLALERDCVELWLRRRHVLAASDPSAREAVTSIGCAIENLAIAAAQYGIACDWQPAPELAWSAMLAPSEQGEVYLGSLSLSGATTPTQEKRRQALAILLQRRTVRAEFESSITLPPELRAELERSTEPSVRLVLFESAADKFAWGKLDELATKHKLEEGAFRRELGVWLLPNDDNDSARGMRGREFGFDDRITRELAARLRGDEPLAVDQLAFMARAGRAGLCSASAVCVLSCLEASPAATIATGRVFQRCMLLAQSHGFVCAVHTAVCHVPHARAMSRATLMKSMIPSVIFRLGKPLHAEHGARPHSSRPRLDDVLIER